MHTQEQSPHSLVISLFHVSDSISLSIIANYLGLQNSKPSVMLSRSQSPRPKPQDLRLPDGSFHLPILQSVLRWRQEPALMVRH